MKTWILPVEGVMYRIVLEKDTLDIWVNGQKAEVAAEFVVSFKKKFFCSSNHNFSEKNN